KVMAATQVPLAADVVNVVVLVASRSAMNSQLYVTTRRMFSLSRARLAPAMFGRVGANGVPLAARAVSSSGVAVAAVLVALYPQTAFTLLMAIAMFGALFAWLMIFVTRLRFRARYRGPTPVFRRWLHPAGSLTGAALVGAVLVTTAFT
ncbi:amino acid permease, partial [Burkholderia pseudomallei]|uniref:amino acid permease n=1 Tax=Burkholderia pseudomallei TaxID=28450 RepID=UPI003CE8702D